VEGALETLKKALERNDHGRDPESRARRVTQTWNEISSKLYQQAGAQQGGPGPKAVPSRAGQGGQPGGKREAATAR
jgi:hypothetical protein